MKKYIWDEEDPSEDADGNLSPHHHSSPIKQQSTSQEKSLTVERLESYLSELSTQLSPKKNHKRDESSSTSVHMTASGNSEVDGAVVSLQEKLDSIKSEIKAKSEEAKELKGELVRFRTILERRERKVRQDWTLKLQESKSKATETISSQQQTLNSLIQGNKVLEEKLHLLVQKIQEYEEKKETTINNAKQDMKKQREQARRQLLVEEQAVFVKAAAKKSTQMQKQVADSFGPKMDDMIIKNKEYLRQKKLNSESDLEKLKIELTFDLESKNEQIIKRQRENVKAMEKNIKVANETKLKTLIEKHSDEIAKLKEMAELQILQLQDHVEKKRKMDDEARVELMHSIQREESEQMKILLADHQRAIVKLIQRNDEVLASTEKELTAQKDSFEVKLRLTLGNESKEKNSLRQKDLHVKFEEETIAILARVRQDMQEERESIQKAFDDKTHKLKLEWQDRIDKLQGNVQRHLQQMNELRQLDKDLDQKITELKNEIHIKSNEISVSENNIERLSKELANSKFTGKLSNSPNRKHVMNRIEDEIHQWKSKLELTTNEINELERTAQDIKENKKREMEEQRNRIELKIERLLNGRKNELQHHKAILEALLEKSSQANEVLEKLREASAATCSLESTPSLGTGNIPMKKKPSRLMSQTTKT